MKTILERTVGELVREQPSRSRIFESFRIDYCCQGKRTLAEACAQKGIAPDEVQKRLEELPVQTADTEFNPATLPPAELADYVEQKHHSYLKTELPRLDAMAEKVARVHGGRHPELIRLHKIQHVLGNQLTAHMVQEEKILFPAVRAMSSGKTTEVTPDLPLASMMHDHEDVGAALAALRELTNEFHAPTDACNTFRALYSGLAELEIDTHRHIHLENEVLFPAAERLLANTAL